MSFTRSLTFNALGDVKVLANIERPVFELTIKKILFVKKIVRAKKRESQIYYFEIVPIFWLT